MSKKLFALESEGVEEVEEVNLEKEELELNEAEAEVQDDVTEVEEQADAVVEGVDASEHLEEIEEVVGKAAEGEGLDEVAAEAIRIAVEAIAARVGAEPKSVYALYAAENFQPASSKKANTQIALEGVKSFLSNLWSKMTSALSDLWDKTRVIFDKLFPSSKAMIKLLETRRKAIAEFSNDFSIKKLLKDILIAIYDNYNSGRKGNQLRYIEAWTKRLGTTFTSDKDISPNLISEYIKSHSDANKDIEKIITLARDITETVESANDKEALKKLTGVHAVGSKTNPLVGGIWFEYGVSLENNKLQIANNKKSIVMSSKDRNFVIENKKSVVSMINEAIALLSQISKMKDLFKEAENDFKKNMKTIEKFISNNEAAKATALQKGTIKAIYKLNSKVPVLIVDKSNMDVKLGKAIIAYTGLCLTIYKKM